VHTSSRRDDFPVFRTAGRKQGSFRLLLQAGYFAVLVQELLELMVDRKLLFFAAFSLNRRKNHFPLGNNLRSSGSPRRRPELGYGGPAQEDDRQCAGEDW
jgi:hypothetical protein